MNESLQNMSFQETKKELPVLPDTKVFEDEENEFNGEIQNGKQAIDGMLRQQWDFLAKSDYLTDKEKEWTFQILSKLFEAPYKNKYSESHQETGSREILFQMPEKSNDFNRFATKLKTLGLTVTDPLSESEIKHKIDETMDGPMLASMPEAMKMSLIEDIKKRKDTITVSNLCSFSNNIG